MERDNYKTKVVFLVNETTEFKDVFAYFPEEDADHSGNKTCYAHIGQHSACSPDYAKESRPATSKEYAALKAELEGIGYNLKVLKTLETTNFQTT